MDASVKVEQKLVNTKVSLEDFVRHLSDDELKGEFEEIYQRAPRSSEVLCGIVSFKSRWLQGLVNA